MFRVPTIRKQFDFVLRDSQFQETFEIEKYQALTYSSPIGIALSEAVEQDWNTWVSKVEQAPWLKYWARFDEALNKTGTPRGEIAQGSEKAQAVALAIYTTGVWGYGVDNWRNSKLMSAKSAGLDIYGGGMQVNQPLVALLKLQNIHCVNEARKFLWDDRIFIGCGLNVPSEFGDLDRWLQPKWNELNNRR